MNARNSNYLDQRTFADLMKPWIHNSKSMEIVKSYGQMIVRQV